MATIMNILFINTNLLNEFNIYKVANVVQKI